MKFQLCWSSKFFTQVNNIDMIQTHGLTHIALKVTDLKRSCSFYQQVFGAGIMYETNQFIQIQTPGSKDIIVLEKADEVIHSSTGILHFGFRLVAPTNIETMIKDVKAAGGEIKESGYFIKEEPYLFFFDPDGYEIEVWYEKIPPELSSFN